MGHAKSETKKIVAGESDHIHMAELKRYKNYLDEQETRLSYWRRLVQGRMDIIEHLKSTSTHSGMLLEEGENFQALVKVLSTSKGFTEGKRLAQKNATVDVVLGNKNLTHTLPTLRTLDNLGHLQEVWDENFTSLTGKHLEEYLKKLKVLERELSRVRKETHNKISSIEREIVQLYKRNPKLALHMLQSRNEPH